VEKTLEFPVLLRLIDERSAAFRAAAESAPGLEQRVPTCPEWTLFELVRHLGHVHRFWAAAVNAGPADAAPAEPASEFDEAEAAFVDLKALLAWSAESTELLLDALREAGPERGCWTWWGQSQTPQIAGAVARHQVQEAMVHAYDAQITLGADRVEPFPEEAARDGVDEFLTTCCEGEDPWPHGITVLDFRITGGDSWRLSLGADGVRATRRPSAPADAHAAFASARGTAAELVLALYGRVPLDSLELEGDRRQLELFRDWD
jgi:uncharacterized protein (TIGR03083 family)